VIEIHGIISFIYAKNVLNVFYCKRKGSIQTSAQEAFILSFEAKYSEMSLTFPSSPLNHLSISQSAVNQQYFLSNAEISSKLFRYRNKAVYGLLENFLLCLGKVEYQDTALSCLIGSSTKIQYNSDETCFIATDPAHVKNFVRRVLSLKMRDEETEARAKALKEKRSFDIALETSDTSEIPAALRSSIVLIEDWFKTRTDSLFTEEILSKVHTFILTKLSLIDRNAIFECQVELSNIFESELSK
jgi:hypothetical protein